MTPYSLGWIGGLGVVGVLTALVGAVRAYRARWLRTQAQAQHWFDRARRAEAVVQDALREDAANRDLDRETADWKRGMDPRIANASPETIDRIWDHLRNGFPDEVAEAAQ